MRLRENERTEFIFGVKSLQAVLIYKDLVSLAGKDAVLTDAPMKDYVSMKTGGPADYLIEPEDYETIARLLAYFREKGTPYLIIGKGSNLIPPDEGIRGVVVRLSDRLSKIEVNETRLTAQSGAALSETAEKALEAGLTGLEFASGIPGTVGGAAAMNAGAYGGEMRDVILETLSINPMGELVRLKGDEHRFGYRKSRIQDEKLTVLSVIMGLKAGDKSAIRHTMDDLNGRRRDKQPLEYPSAGSVFKRPEGYYAGKLIEDCGLKGFALGGAMVSEKHSGFIVNTGSATTADIKALICHIQRTVFEKTGVSLETEVKIIEGSTPCNFSS